MRIVKVIASPAGRRGVSMRPAGALLAALVLVLAGCRGYGRYDAQEKMLPEMRQAVELSAGNLERARSSLDLLRQAARGDSALHLVAEEYDQAVAQHEQIVRENQALLTRFEDDLPDYRTMHRTLGAVIAEQKAVRSRYRSLVRATRYPDITSRMEKRSGGSAGAMRSLPDTLAGARDESFTEGRYFVAPIFYERLQSADGEMTMRQALAERTQRQSQQRRLGRSSEGSSLLRSSGSAPADTARRAP